MPLALIAGPANAGKVELLLDRYLELLDADPWLIVPTGSDVERVERQLVARCGCLLNGTIGTFDTLFAELAGGERPLVSEAQRALLVRRVVARASLSALAVSARFGGFADALAQALAEIDSGLLEPNQLDGELAVLYAAYHAELDRLDRWDRPAMRRRAVDRLRTDLDAWHGRPLFAYGFEDLTGAEWALLEGLAGRAEVSVSLPYEPGRPAFASLVRTADDLQRLAGANIVELPARYGEVAHVALAHVERSLFSDEHRPPVPSEGAVRFLEGAGTRGALELVGEELLALLRGGVAAERIGLVCPSVDRVRAPLETALGMLGIPFSVDGELRLAQTPFGQALTSLVRFAWLGGSRRELFTFLRSPFSGLERRAVDFVEGRLRGRAVQQHDRVLEETEKMRGGALPILDELRDAADPIEAVRTLATRMLRNAYDPERPPVGETSRLDLRAYEEVDRLLRELERWEDVTRDEVLSALERHTLRMLRGDEPGRVAVIDLARARTRRFDVVFVLGLEEGSLPRRGGASPFLDDDARRALDDGGARLQRPDAVARDRYLFYTACTRPLDRLYLVREAATDDGSPREPSPFWDELRALLEDAPRWTFQRRLSQLTWPVDGAPTERERLRALAELGARDAPAAESLARANGWERRLERALDAFHRPTRITHALVLEQLDGKRTFNVTELERFADCSSAWFVERFLDPKSIDKEVDPLTRGSVAHTALYRFFTRVPKELGIEKLDEGVVDDALRLMRSCLDEALQGVRMDMTTMEERELDQTLWRDLEAVVRAECESELTFVPRYFEQRFGTDVQPGLDLGAGLTLSGKIDRIDVDPFGARGIVQDYKSGKHAHSAREIESELRLQIPLYMLVLRDLVGLEPLGGVYRPLAGERKARGILRSSESETLHGFAKNDYLDDDAFWSSVDNARAKASELAQRIRAGDVRHDPKGSDCPPWCDLWSMCRVERA